MFTSVYPVVSSSKNGKVIIVSTPNGKDNLYYDLWKKANDKDNPDNTDGWRAFRMDWWQIPGRDENWKKAQIAAIGPTRFAQEFNNEFLDDVTTTKLISDETADKFRIQLTEFKAKGVHQGKALFVTSPDGKKNYPFKMWHDFDPKRTYLASADVAEGIGKDSSVLYIWDVTDLSNIRLCCAFSDNKTSILEFAYAARQILRLYADPYLACESNGISIAFIEQLRVTYAYENFVRMNKGGCGIDSHWVLKTKACLWCRDMLTTMGFGFELYDPVLVDEFSSFIKKDGSKQTVYAAIKGAHDDHLMTFVWACWILNPDNVEKYYRVGATFTSSTGVTFPKSLSPYYGYEPSELEFIRDSQQVKDFQIYKSMNNNDFLKEHEKKVAEENKVVMEYVQSDGDRKREMEELHRKSVLSEAEVLKMMREQAELKEMDRLGSTGEAVKTSAFKYDPMYSAGNNSREPYDRRMLNVLWSSYEDAQGGIDGVFGFDDDPDEKMW